ncbi:MAG: hypothetical protein IIT93_02980, partial [Paludibacteraceae bacterium]|nr:hypothetical protein [Paludibacteraceae bacterium]
EQMRHDRADTVRSGGDVRHTNNEGDKVEGYIEKVREDGKVDVRLKKNGYDSVSSEAEAILSKLKAEGGFIPTTDKTEPEKIYAIYGISKKTYKKAVGDLYKRHLITLTPIGIKLS